MPKISKQELEEFCHHIKRKFQYNPHFDKADLLIELTAFLKAHDVEVGE